MLLLTPAVDMPACSALHTKDDAHNTGMLPQPLVSGLTYDCVCVCLQALRSAFDRFFSSGSFEVVLKEADTAADNSSSSSKQQAWGSVKYGKQAAAAPAGSGGGADGAAGAAAERLHTVLLRRPAVFTLAVVWESPKVGLSGLPHPA